MGEDRGDERRRFRRRALTADCYAEAGGEPLKVQLLDISRAGARFVAEPALPAGTAIRLSLHSETLPVAASVVRRDGNEHGCAFDEPLPDGLLDDLALLAALYGGDLVTAVHDASF